MREPRLDAHSEPAAPRASVLLLHGAQELSTDDVSNRHTGSEGRA